LLVSRQLRTHVANTRSGVRSAGAIPLPSEPTGTGPITCPSRVSLPLWAHVLTRPALIVRVVARQDRGQSLFAQILPGGFVVGAEGPYFARESFRWDLLFCACWGC
jgi:hypothetical protein